MLSCVGVDILIHLKKLFSSFNDTKMEDIVAQNIHPYFEAFYPMKYFCTKDEEDDDDDEEEEEGKRYKSERINIDGDYLSFGSDEYDKVGVYIGEEQLTPNCCYFEVEIVEAGMDASLSIGVCCKDYPLDVHIGFDPESIGLSSDDGRIRRGGWVGPRFDVKFERGDRIGCGLKFDQVSDSGDEPFETVVPVFFVHNGKELGTSLFSLPAGGTYPAVSMHSLGEVVRLVMGASWLPEEDSLMSIDNNEDDWYRMNDVRLNGQILEYVGRGKGIVDVGFAQARAPLTTTTHYFEIEIVDPGENCYIAIGLTKRNYPKHRHPGWDKGSIGYHADDGKIFIGSGLGDPFGPRCHKGDRMGCGILFPRDYVCEYDSDGGVSDEICPASPVEPNDLLELSLESSDSEDEDWWRYSCGTECEGKVKVFFTRNGNGIGHREVCIPKGGYFPTVGMLSIREKVKVDLRPLTG